MQVAPFADEFKFKSPIAPLSYHGMDPDTVSSLQALRNDIMSLQKRAKALPKDDKLRSSLTQAVMKLRTDYDGRLAVFKARSQQQQCKFCPVVFLFYRFYFLWSCLSSYTRHGG
jgi:hypothetical protein